MILAALPIATGQAESLAVGLPVSFEARREVYAMDNEWTPEKITRFIEVNGYNPTTQEGLFKHIDELIVKLNELSDVRDTWEKRMDLPFDEAYRNFEHAHKDVEFWVEQLKKAFQTLGGIVYNEARPKR